MKTIAALMGLLLSACAPMMEVQYQFLPPQDSEGQVCALQCVGDNKACLRKAESAAQDQRRRCELEAAQDYDLCNLRPAADGQARCERQRCEMAAETAECDAPYRACFEGCGGFIEARHVCTSGCK